MLSKKRRTKLLAVLLSLTLVLEVFSGMGMTETVRADETVSGTVVTEGGTEAEENIEVEAETKENTEAESQVEENTEVENETEENTEAESETEEETEEPEEPKVPVFHVVFDANGGTGTTEGLDVTYGVISNLTANGFTNGTRAFTGWTCYRTSDDTWFTKEAGFQTQSAIDANGYTKYVYGNGAKLARTSSVDDDTVVMYAQWGAAHFYVAFDSNGGSGTMKNMTITYGVTSTLTKNAFTKDGYLFKGWTCYRACDQKWLTSNGWRSEDEIASGSYSKYVYGNGAKLAKTCSIDGATITMYAQWEKIPNKWTKVNGTWTFVGSYGTFKSNKMYAAWSKIKNKTSKTKYYIVVDCTACETYIFCGAAGKWVPYKLWKCSPGKPSTKTKQGTFTLGGHGYSFSLTGLTCYYWTRFYNSYLFHSTLYKYHSWTPLNSILGKQLSHGCVRLLTANAKWLQENIPQGTKVLTYY